MNVLVFLLLPVMIVAAYAVYQWARGREPSSLESGVDAFRREMQALSPEARPGLRRPEPEPELRRPERPGAEPREPRPEPRAEQGAPAPAPAPERRAGPDRRPPAPGGGR